MKFGAERVNPMSRNVRKRTFGHVRRKTQISPSIQTVWSESSLSAWETYSGYPKCAQGKMLIILRECTGWSKSSLDAHVRGYVLGRYDSFISLFSVHVVREQKLCEKKIWLNYFLRFIRLPVICFVWKGSVPSFLYFETMERCVWKISS